MTYYSPESFDIRDGDHDHALTANWRTPRQAAKIVLGFQEHFEECLIGVDTPDGELRLPPAGPLPEVFTAYLRRDKVLIYTPDVLQEEQKKSH